MILESYIVEAQSFASSHQVPGGDTGGNFDHFESNSDDEGKQTKKKKGDEETKGDFGVRFTMSGPTVPYYNAQTSN